MKRKQRFRGLFVFVSAFFVMLSAVLYTNINNNIMNAETEIDDGPSGEKIVDIERMISSDASFAITEKGEVYSWGGSKMQMGQGDGATSFKKPRKVLNASNETDGKTYLSGIKKIFCAQSIIYALKNDGTVYVWGRNYNGTSGIQDLEDETNLYTPRKLDLAFKVKDVVVTTSSVILLSEDGDVYTVGKNDYGFLGTGQDESYISRTFQKIEIDNLGNPLPKIKEIGATTWLAILLTTDGKILELGSQNAVSNGESKNASRPTQALYEDLSEVDNIKEFVVQSNMDKGSGLLLRDINDKLYRPRIYGKTHYYTPLYTTNLKVTDSYGAFPHFDNFGSSQIGGSYFVYDNQVFNLLPYDRESSCGGVSCYGFDSDEYLVSKYSEGLITKSYANAKKAIGYYTGGTNRWVRVFILSNDGGVFKDGVKVSFGDILIKGNKKDNSAYLSKTKYNNDISLSITPSETTIDNVRYTEKDLIANTTGAVQTATSPMSITALDETRVYRQFDFYIEGQDEETKINFIVDLYKKALTLSDVTDDAIYGAGKTISLPDNGFSGNTVSATLSKDGGAATSYTSDTPINDAGNYVILAKDLYGNSVSYSFGVIGVKGVKKDSTLYAPSEKYNDSIDLNVEGVNASTLSNLRYKMTDHIDSSNSITTETTTGISLAVNIEEGKRINRTYDFYLAGQEDDTKTSFTVDLYKKSISLSDVKAGGKYAIGKTITIPTINGLADNTVSATLAKDGETATTYTSEASINEVGNYVITATDLYGNSVSYSFSIVDTPIPSGVEFTKSTSGELTYGNAITKVNGILGSLSLVYPEGQETSTIKTLILGTGGDEGNFEIVNTNQLKVKGSDLTAKEYTLNVSGTDQNDMAFSGVVKFTVGKATQTMAWNDTSSALSSNGVTVGGTAQLGVKDLLGSASVIYSLKTPNSCATINGNEVSITCLPNPASITLVATPSADNNYDNKAIELTVPISKKAITLKVELDDAGTYKNDMTIKLGDALPGKRISCDDASINVSTLGTPNYTYKKNGGNVVNPSIEEGIYTLSATYPSGGVSDNYTITWSDATLRVEGITLEEDDLKDYFTLTSGGNPYTAGDWTKDAVIITPIHSTFSRMDVDDAGSLSNSAYTYQVEGDKQVKLTFATTDGAKISATINVKIDKTKPVIQDNTYTNADNALRSLLRAITFDQYFDEAQNVSFNATDTGSGVVSYQYEIVEVNDAGVEQTSTLQSGTAIPSDKFLLSLNKNYKIKVKAQDAVGNVSDENVETIYISDAVAQLSVTAKHDGKAYDGTTWVDSAVDFTLNSNSASGVEKYQYSTDGVSFTDFTSSDGTISLPATSTNQKNVLYTFRAINNDGTTCDKTFHLKLDKDKPVIQVKGTVEGASYDGSVVDKDVSLVPYQTTGNISGITYYYTSDAASKDANPLTDSNWKAYGTGLTQTTNGTITYYFKGVSGAGVVSDPVEYIVQIANKAITVNVELNQSGSYSKDVSIKLGDSLPNMRVTCDDAGIDLSTFGTPTFTYTKSGSVIDNPTIEEGIYVVTASFPGNAIAAGYNITYNTATLRVNGITIEEGDYGDYFTLTSGGKAYTPDTWTEDPIIITPIHDNFNRLDVDDAGAPSSTPTTYQIEGNHNVKLSFYSPEGAKTSITLVFKYDKTKPVMQANTYVDADSSLRAMLRSVTFNQYFKKAQKVSFHANDTGSGIASYQYEIVELDSSGLEITSSKKTGTASTTDQITLALNKNYKLKVKAVDQVGNISDEQIETVSISDQVAQLSVTAKNKGIAYDGTKWVNSAINFTLQSNSASGVEKYQYSTNGTTFIDFTSSDGTITLPNPLTNQNNVTYTFRAIHNDGTSCDKTFQAKVDATKPVLQVSATTKGNSYDGSVVDQDVTLTPSQGVPNISGSTYYYTTNAASKDSNPTTDGNWKAMSGSLTHSQNGTTTYYFKAVSGAGLVSDTVSQVVKIAKKEYTTINVQVSTEGNPYRDTTWAKHDLTFTLSGGLKDASQITGYEYTTTTGARPTSSATWKAVSGNGKHVETQSIKGLTYWFRVVPVDTNASLSSPYKVQLDVDTPSVPTLSIKEKNTSPVARFINAISFGNWLNKEIEVTMTSSDSTSGIAYYMIEENQNGKAVKNTTGKVSYGDETNTKIRVKACDNAGNCSAYSSDEQIMIDTQPPVINGVKDQSEYKQYYLPRFVSASDEDSGLLSASYTKDGVVTPIATEVKIKGIGTYQVNAEDNAGNTTSLAFKIVAFPDLDDIDGSDESKEIIDQIQKELDENKDKYDQTEIDDTNDWLDDANDKWESLRKKVVEDEDKTSKVEGVGDTSFDPKVELVVDPIEEDILPVLPRRAMYSYDVYLKKGTTVVQPNGEIKVYLPYPDNANPIIYEIDKDGNVREITAVKEGEYVVFTTNSLMKYAISNTEQEIIDDGKVVVPGPDGKLDTDDDVTANPSDKGDKPIQNPDGTVTVPPGGSVTYPDGGVVETPDGGILNPDGSLTLPDGTVIDPSGKPSEPEDPSKPEDPKDPEKPEDPKDPDTSDKDINIDSDDDGKADVNVDVDCDGKADINIDTDDDGLPDINIDTTGDGKPNYNVDLDGDEKADLNIGPVKWKTDKCVSGGCVLYCTSTYYKPYLNIDTDGDNRPDVNVDLDKDSFADINIDIDGDNTPDIDIDSDGDGKADINVDTDDDGRPNKNLALILKWKPDKDVDQPIKYDTMSGIVINETLTPDTWHPSGDIPSGNQGNQDNESKNPSTDSPTGAMGGASTGDTSTAIGMWILFIISAIISIVMHRLKKNMQR